MKNKHILKPYTVTFTQLMDAEEKTNAGHKHEGINKSDCTFWIENICKFYEKFRSYNDPNKKEIHTLKC